MYKYITDQTQLQLFSIGYMLRNLCTLALQIGLVFILNVVHRCFN